MLRDSSYELTCIEPFGRVALLRSPGTMALDEEARPRLPPPPNPNEQVYTSPEQGET